MATEQQQTESDSMESGEISPLQSAVKAVDDLFEFRDHYFEQHSLSEAIKKTEYVAEQLKQTLQVLDNLQDKVDNKAVWYMLRGKALNIKSGFDPESQELLSKAVKLDPKLVEAWINLGEMYWKNKDIESAKDCFTGALNHAKDKKALRNLSMVLRQCGSNEEERYKNTEESIEKAKEAVQLDIKDGTSWFILGNAYLSLFFSTTQNPRIIKQCLSAYQQAERDPITCCNADLHFNRATAYKYQEDFELALLGFSRAAALDPTWTEPSEKEEHLVGFLSRVQDLIRTKGKLKAKRLQTLVHSIKESDLGPYGGGSYTSQKGQTIRLDKVTLDDLQPEFNKEKVIVGKVICTVVNEDPVPFTFCMVDEKQNFFSVSVFNMMQGYGVKISDSVAIPEPFLQKVDIQYKDKMFQFDSLRIDSPVVMVVNGRKLGLDKQAPSVLAVSAMSE